MQSEEDFIKNIKVNENLSTLFVDGATIHKRKDGMYYIVFAVSLPDGIREQVRFMIGNEPLRKILDVFCRISNYYPEKPKVEKVG